MTGSALFVTGAVWGLAPAINLETIINTTTSQTIPLGHRNRGIIKMFPPLSGFLQSIKVSSGKQVTITDQLYGEHTISEPVLVSLFESPELRRLDGVHQHGVT